MVMVLVMIMVKQGGEKGGEFEKLQLSQQNKNEQEYKNIHSPLSKGKKEPRLFTKVPPMSGPHKGVG
jgi:hypothetical protein